MFRIGFGYDAHQLAPGTPLILGGVQIPWEKGLVSHSDGDVVLHALMDALLGAACLGDIGRHFPDGDPAYGGCSSLRLLGEVGGKIRLAGYTVNNADCTVLAQRPKIAPYAREMRVRIAGALETETDRISVKASTTEHLGFVGREEGIVCYAVCTIVKSTGRFEG